MNTDGKEKGMDEGESMEALYREMGVFFKGFGEHVYIFREWKGSGVRKQGSSAIPFPLFSPLAYNTSGAGRRRQLRTSPFAIPGCKL